MAKKPEEQMQDLMGMMKIQSTTTVRPNFLNVKPAAKLEASKAIQRMEELRKGKKSENMSRIINNKRRMLEATGNKDFLKFVSQAADIDFKDQDPDIAVIKYLKDISTDEHLEMIDIFEEYEKMEEDCSKEKEVKPEVKTESNTGDIDECRKLLETLVLDKKKAETKEQEGAQLTNTKGHTESKSPLSDDETPQETFFTPLTMAETKRQ
jgi:hypothetical protein